MKRMIQGGLILALASRTHREIGAVGERWLCETLERQGYRVAYGQLGKKEGDLRVIDVITGEVLKIEVKTARQCKDGKWRFTLAKDGHTDHQHADMVALLAVMASGRVIPFVMPVEAVANQRQAVITSHPERYAGKLACWRVEGQINL
jgi:hypothetical protein